MDMTLPQTSPRFWNRIARKYARQPIGNEAAYEHKLKTTQDLMTPHMSVLEIGCGTGSTALRHAAHVAQYHATDFSEDMIAIAREKTQNAPDSLSFGVESVEDMATTTRYDMILALSVLHLVLDRKAVLAKIYEMLPHGGTFVSSTACLGDMSWAIRAILKPGYWLGFFPPVGVFTAQALRNELRATGFEITYDWRPGPREAVFLIARKPD